MKRGFVLSFIAVCLITLDLFLNAYSEDIKKEDRFFLNSLHFTTRGMTYWYDKANGGLETLTGIQLKAMLYQAIRYSLCSLLRTATQL